jgi:hypothetical protein
MYSNPHIGGEIARERQRDMIAQAHQQRLAREARDLTGVSRRAAWAKRWLTRSRKRRPAVLPSLIEESE